MKDIVKHAMPAQIDAALRERLERVECATVGHFMHACFMDRSLQAANPERRVAGTAVTLQIAANDSALLHDVIGDLREGDILVIDRAGDDHHACWGGVMTNAAVVQGLAGVVVDGPATDMGEVRRHDLALWSRGVSAVTTKLYGSSGAFNVPISCGGRTVRPGDAIIADESGVIVLDPDVAPAVAERALGMQEAEIDLIRRLQSGERLGDITGASKMVRDRL